jgi:tetratricopeptide (TPR) repeat protein
MFETDRAVEHIVAALALQPEQPHGVRARAHLQLGRAYDRLGQRALAMTEYRAAERHAPADESGRMVRDRAREGLQFTPQPAIGEAYRLSLEGLRALERGDVQDALRRLTQSVRLNPVDPVARFRYAQALDASGDRAAAETHLAALSAATNVPAVAHSAVLVAYAAMRERAGDHERALDLYRRARDTTGGAPRAHDEARAAITRLAR